MKMKNLPMPLILIAACYITLVTCQSDTDGNFDSENNLNKRLERYTFGLGKRAYTYISAGGPDGKRFPVYNFGLGKRARPYSFGLGKRAEFDNDYSDLSASYDKESFDEGIKRGRPYSFGLGKRGGGTDDLMERRSSQHRIYDFGLGRR